MRKATLHEGPTLLWTYRRGGLGSGWHRSSPAHHRVACSCLSVTREMLSMKGPTVLKTASFMRLVSSTDVAIQFPGWLFTFWLWNGYA